MRLLVPLTTAVLLAAPPAWAEPLLPDWMLPDWTLSGNLAARAEIYDNFGDPAAAVFPDVGGQAFAEGFLRFDRRVSAFERFSGFASGVLNRSDYRSFNDGLVLERFQFDWEKGDASLPFKLTLGDSFAFFSPRSVQRSIKGAQLELQPGDGQGPHLTSIQIFAGTDVPVYRDFDQPFTSYAGASALHQRADGSSFIVNAVGAYRRADQAVEGLGQAVFTAAAEQPFEIGSHALTFEAEIGLFAGEHSVGQGRAADIGLFSQLSGQSLDQRLSYRLLYERYGEDYQPFGASIIPGRSSTEAHLAYRFDNGLVARGRAQRFIDGLEGANPTESYVLGFGLTGPFLPEVGLAGSFDAFGRIAEDELGLRDEVSFTAQANLFAPIAEAWTGRARLFVQTIDDRVQDDRFSTFEIDVSADHSFSAQDWRGIVSPGMRLRRITGGGGEAVELGPSIALNTANGGHSVQISYSLLAQMRLSTGAEDQLNHQLAAAYTFRSGRHRFGVDGSLTTRNPETGLPSNSVRAGVFYRYDFHRPAAVTAPPVRSQTGFDQRDLIAYFPGLSAASATRFASVFGEGVEIGPFRVYAAVLLPSLAERQRLVLEQRNGRLVRSGLIIDLDETGRGEDFGRVFSRVEEILARRYGRPAVAIDEGAFGADAVEDVNLERLVRLREWRTEQGILRLGLPRRLDRAVRIELHHAESFPGPEDTLWSFDEIQ